jgi:hypothetical protein
MDYSAADLGSPVVIWQAILSNLPPLLRLNEHIGWRAFERRAKPVRNGSRALRICQIEGNVDGNTRFEQLGAFQIRQSFACACNHLSSQNRKGRVANKRCNIAHALARIRRMRRAFIFDSVAIQL